MAQLNPSVYLDPFLQAVKKQPLEDHWPAAGMTLEFLYKKKNWPLVEFNN